VIHSFWVPEFRVKQDALPGTERELRVTPTLVGDYSLACAEMCGKQHAYMTAPVRVLSQEDFDAWVAEQLASISSDPVVRGESWYNEYGCAACHTLDARNSWGLRSRAFMAAK
jgi:cytochrome c oxidase subunit 2